MSEVDILVSLGLEQPVHAHCQEESRTLPFLLLDGSPGSLILPF